VADVRTRPARALLLCVAVVAAGAAARADEVETVEGCEVKSVRAKWVEDNEAQVSWSGPCKKDLAEGTGVLYFVAKDGTWARYVGAMSGGWYEGEGDYRTTTGARKVGRFSGNLLAEGKVYRADGSLEYEGKLVSGTDDYGVGTFHLSDGRRVEGTFERGATSFNADGLGIAYGAVHDIDGAVSHWVVGGQRYAAQDQFDAAVRSYQQYLVARRAAEREAEEQREAEERARREAEAARTYNAITGVLLGAANAYVQQQQAQLGAYTPPPMPVWTPPVPAYTPPAPVYQAPVLSPNVPSNPTQAGDGTPLHQPELDASGCIKLEQEASGRVVLANRCGQVAEVTWCVVGRDCNPGYSNTWTISAGGTWPVGSGAVTVNWGACLGANSIWATSEMSRNKQYRCTR
jgi:hypothetical protein